MSMGNPYTSIEPIKSTSALEDRVRRAVPDSTGADRRGEMVRNGTSSGAFSHSVLIASTPLTCFRYMGARTNPCSGLLIGYKTFHPTVGTMVSVRVGPNLVLDTARERTKEVTKIYHAITIIIPFTDPVGGACAIRALKGKRPAQC